MLQAKTDNQPASQVCHLFGDISAIQCLICCRFFVAAGAGLVFPDYFGWSSTSCICASLSAFIHDFAVLTISKALRGSRMLSSIVTSRATWGPSTKRTQDRDAASAL